MAKKPTDQDQADGDDPLPPGNVGGSPPPDDARRAYLNVVAERLEERAKRCDRRSKWFLAVILMTMILGVVIAIILPATLSNIDFFLRSETGGSTLIANKQQQLTRAENRIAANNDSILKLRSTIIDTLSSSLWVPLNGSTFGLDEASIDSNRNDFDNVWVDSVSGNGYVNVETQYGSRVYRFDNAEDKWSIPALFDTNAGFRNYPNYYIDYSQDSSRIGVLLYQDFALTDVWVSDSKSPEGFIPIPYQRSNLQDAVKSKATDVNGKVDFNEFYARTFIPNSDVTSDGPTMVEIANFSVFSEIDQGNGQPKVSHVGIAIGVHFLDGSFISDVQTQSVTAPNPGNNPASGNYPNASNSFGYDISPDLRHILVFERGQADRASSWRSLRQDPSGKNTQPIMFGYWVNNTKELIVKPIEFPKKYISATDSPILISNEGPVFASARSDQQGDDNRESLNEYEYFAIFVARDDAKGPNYVFHAYPNDGTPPYPENVNIFSYDAFTLPGSVSMVQEVNKHEGDFDEVRVFTLTDTFTPKLLSVIPNSYLIWQNRFKYDLGYILLSTPTRVGREIIQILDPKTGQLNEVLPDSEQARETGIIASSGNVFVSRSFRQSHTSLISRYDLESKTTTDVVSIDATGSLENAFLSKDKQHGLFLFTGVDSKGDSRSWVYNKISVPEQSVRQLRDIADDRKFVEEVRKLTASRSEIIASQLNEILSILEIQVGLNKTVSGLTDDIDFFRSLSYGVASQGAQSSPLQAANGDGSGANSGTSNSSVTDFANAINVKETTVRFIVIALLLYLVQILVSLYRYNTRLAAFYSARRDSLDTFGEPLPPFEAMVPIMSPELVDYGKQVRHPFEYLSQVIPNFGKRREADK